MASQSVERKLSAVLAADVAGYSRLMGADEEGTLARLTAHRRELFDPAIARHRGRIVKTTGDGLLATFASVVDAVRCAAEVQAGMAERNSAAGGPRIDFRIGINVGDIVEQDNDIFGDGVNIAARLEGIADPGGICVSARVQEDTAGRIDVAFEDMGEQNLKNIARPVRAFRVRTGAQPPRGQAPPPPSDGTALPERPSIAVLPFQNMSADPEQDYFADGIVEDIITALSRFKSFAVVARNSSFVYKGKAIDVRQAAKELGVRYILEGSVRRAGARLRITAQLIEASAGAHLWADKFDGAAEDVFDVQDRITQSVVMIVEPRIREAEIERSRRERPESLVAYDLYLRALPAFRTGIQADNAVAYDLLKKAMELEPNNAVVLAQAANTLQHRDSMGWPPLAGNDKAEVRELVRRAMANAHDDASVLSKCGNALLQVNREYDLGFATIMRAANLNPNNAEILANAGIGSMHVGDPDDALRYFNRALDLSPNDPFAFVPLTGIAVIELMRGRYAEAVATAERSLAAHTSFDPTYWVLISANAQLGRMAEARNWAAKFQALVPGNTIARIKAGQPDRHPERLAAMWEGLRLAGLPEA
jgi:TolB-like protein/class 3 adenylate cyclase/Tfp pilus assembly protein PilF